MYYILKNFSLWGGEGNLNSRLRGFEGKEMEEANKYATSFVKQLSEDQLHGQMFGMHMINWAEDGR